MLRFNRLVKQRRVLTWILVYLVAGLLLPAGQLLAQDNNSVETLRKTGEVFAKIAKAASPSVVYIVSEKEVRRERTPNRRMVPPNMPFGNDDFFNFFFRDRDWPQAKPQPQIGQGSGFIVSTDGYILTNNHVVKGADKITVKLLDGRERKAKLVGTDPQTDVAVIKIEADDLPVQQLGDSDALEVGEWVLAIGNPFGLSHTVTAGIVSAKGRRVISDPKLYQDFIQTDAAINPGNSGGPLIDLDGKVIGINTMIISQSGGYMGIGFAIPINMAKDVMDQLMKHGKVTRGYLGVTIIDLTPEMAKSFDLDKDQKGILIQDVLKDTPAEKAGLKHGDLIVELNGNTVTESDPFRNQVAMLPVGTEIKLGIIRKGERENIELKIGLLDEGAVAAAEPSDLLDKLGLAVQNLSDDLAKELGYEDETGVVVSQVEPGSLADESGLRRGILVKEVNHKEIRNTDDFEKAVTQAQAGEKDSALLYVSDGKYNYYLSLKLKD